MASQPTYSCVLINALLQLTVAAWKFCWKKTIQSRRFSQHYQILALRISAADDITDIGIVLAKQCNLISCSFVLHIDWLKPFLTDHAIPCGINGLTNFICLLWWNAMIVTIEKKVRFYHTLPFITKQRVAVRLRLPPDGTRVFYLKTNNIYHRVPPCNGGLGAIGLVAPP